MVLQVSAKPAASGDVKNASYQKGEKDREGGWERGGGGGERTEIGNRKVFWVERIKGFQWTQYIALKSQSISHQV